MFSAMPRSSQSGLMVFGTSFHAAKFSNFILNSVYYGVSKNKLQRPHKEMKAS
jgi:hypothetical protein